MFAFVCVCFTFWPFSVAVPEKVHKSGETLELSRPFNYRSVNKDGRRDAQRHHHRRHGHILRRRLQKLRRANCLIGSDPVTGEHLDVHAGGGGRGGTCGPSHKKRAGFLGRRSSSRLRRHAKPLTITYGFGWGGGLAQRLGRHQLIRADTHTRSRTPL